MQVVINITDSFYDRLVNMNSDSDTCSFNESALVESVKNGIPLQKGHDRLIAEPTEEEITKTIGGNNDFAECIRDAVKTVFENAQTIIEADVPKRRKGTPLEENDSGYNCENWIP